MAAVCRRAFRYSEALYQTLTTLGHEQPGAFCNAPVAQLRKVDPRSLRE